MKKISRFWKIYLNKLNDKRCLLFFVLGISYVLFFLSMNVFGEGVQEGEQLIQDEEIPLLQDSGTKEIQPKEKKIMVGLGKDVDITLKGPEWIFTGIMGDKEGLVFSGKNIAEENSVFSFTAKKTGEYVLSFQKQNLENNSFQNENIKILVNKEEARQIQVTTSKTTLPVHTTTKRNVQNIDVFLDALEAKDQTRIDTSYEILKKNSNTTDAEIVKKILERSKKLEKENEIGKSINVLENWLDMEETPGDVDSFYFLLARLYERETRYKSIHKAFTYYTKIQKNWPQSRYWDDANQKVNYYERHFIYVR